MLMFILNAAGRSLKERTKVISGERLTAEDLNLVYCQVLRVVSIVVLEIFHQSLGVLAGI